MRFIANENVEKRIVNALRKNNHDVVYCAELKSRMDDDIILQMANKEKRILITNDKDFGELIYIQRKIAYGVLLLCFQTENSLHKSKIINEVLEKYKDKIPHHFVTISERKVRIRPLK